MRNAATLQNSLQNRQEFQEVTRRRRSVVAWHPICDDIIPELNFV